jgi:uncharacterized protein (TIGR02246 family)
LPAFDLSIAKTEIEAMNKKFMEAVSKGDSVAVASYYTADAKFMGPNAAAVVGRGNIQSDIGGLIKAGLTKLVLTTTEVWGNENFVGEEGVMTLSTADGKPVDQGKYIVLWKKEDGSWKLHRDIFNSDLPLPKDKLFTP